MIKFLRKLKQNIEMDMIADKSRESLYSADTMHFRNFYEDIAKRNFSETSVVPEENAVPNKFAVNDFSPRSCTMRALLVYVRACTSARMGGADGGGRELGTT